MHFSSPSGQRFSWWRPWNRGAVGRRSSGYSTVSAFLNIWWKVTPKPLTGLRKSSAGDLLAVARGPGVQQRARGSGLARAGHADAVVVRQVERRDGEAPRLRRRAAGGPGRLRGGVVPALAPCAPAVPPPPPHPPHRPEEHQHHAADDGKAPP